MTIEEVFADFDANFATPLCLANAAPITGSVSSIAPVRRTANACAGAAGAFLAFKVLSQILDHLLLLVHIILGIVMSTDSGTHAAPTRLFL